MDAPSCSSSNSMSQQNDELNELSLVQGVNVWGSNQDVLEKQALKELEIFSHDHKDKKSNLEEGEIDNEPGTNEPSKTSSTLDIGSYIKKQEELKRQKDLLKSLQVSEQSRNAAENICKKQKQHKQRKRKESSNNNVIKLNKTNDSQENVSFVDAGVNKDDGSKESGSEYVPSDGEIDSDYDPGHSKSVEESKKIPSRTKQTKHNIEKVKDDGLISCYKHRLDKYYKTLEEENELKFLDQQEEVTSSEEDFYAIKGGLKIPRKVWDKLYGYQQDGIEWLWQLHTKSSGGLLGDEMGLGKTVQIIVFLLALEFSKTVSLGRFLGMGPSIVVCPATVIHQWVQHFHEWAPEFRVAVLHQSGTYQGNKAKLIKEIHGCKGVILTTYLGILKYKGNLVEYNWHYVILDEGHKIRNPTAKITVAVKQLRTPYRLLLTGSPMQNNLTELWSLFDFTNPGMLGNLSIFTEHFANPILQGGFSNASTMQEATALSVATTLKNVISPFLLRRTKVEVQDHILLPHKTEQVLFCSLTKEQVDLYKGYLMSEQVNNILGRGTKNWYSDTYLRGSVLVAITTLRKICNHPDIYLHDADNVDEENLEPEERFGFYKKSGKMVVVSALLKIWKKQKHRVLLFTQGRAMILVFQEFLEQNGYKYLKMDGSTAVSARQPLIDKFNQDESFDLFLSTTRVGGLGVNLTGADRVIIFDPDWNPATDTQARERAWRIGQEKQVTIYRLVSAGTIEEKMYQRQVWKQLLSNKILIDPKTHRFFKSSDLHDLFSLQETHDNINPETTNIFHDSRVKIQERINKQKKEKKKNKSVIPSEGVVFTEDKVQEMKNLAQQIAKSMNKEPVIKTPYQKELETERDEKLKEKSELKKMSAMELLTFNRIKAACKTDDNINRIDNCDTSISFSNALQYADNTSKLYHDLKTKKIKEEDLIRRAAKRKSEVDSNESVIKKEKKKRSRDKTIVDTSRMVDGEKVEGLIKSESNKKKKERSNIQDDSFVLEKLFLKKGVAGALEHDSIVQSKRPENSLRIHTEAKLRADKSLEALQKSRLENWRY